MHGTQKLKKYLFNEDKYVIVQNINRGIRNLTQDYKANTWQSQDLNISVQLQGLNFYQLF